MHSVPDRISHVWAIVPIKELATAKQRLSAAFTPRERELIVLAMAEDVFRALDGSDIAGIVVVTRDEKVAALGSKFGARVIADTGEGASLAVNTVQNQLAEEGKQATIVVPGDVPLINPNEIHKIADAWHEDETVAIAPSHDLMGSNVVFCAPPNIMPLEFGPGSFSVHVRKAEASGLSPKVVHLACAALDIDHPIDLYNFVRTYSDTITYRLMSELLSYNCEGTDR